MCNLDYMTEMVKKEIERYESEIKDINKQLEDVSLSDTEKIKLIKKLQKLTGKIGKAPEGIKKDLTFCDKYNHSSYSNEEDTLQCRGTCKDEHRCERKIINGNGYCWQHQEQIF